MLPNGTVLLISLLEWIVKVATSESNKSIFIGTKLIDGPNVNQRGKLWITLILLAQFLLNCLAHLHTPFRGIWKRRSGNSLSGISGLKNFRFSVLCSTN
jgi:hypothetical protein